MHFGSGKNLLTEGSGTNTVIAHGKETQCSVGKRATRWYHLLAFVLILALLGGGVPRAFAGPEDNVPATPKKTTTNKPRTPRKSTAKKDPKSATEKKATTKGTRSTTRKKKEGTAGVVESIVPVPSSGAATDSGVVTEGEPAGVSPVPAPASKPRTPRSRKTATKEEPKTRRATPRKKTAATNPTDGPSAVSTDAPPEISPSPPAAPARRKRRAKATAPEATAAPDEATAVVSATETTAPKTTVRRRTKVQATTSPGELSTFIPAVGLETEYAGADELTTDRKKKDKERYLLPLRKLKEIYAKMGLPEGSGGEVKLTKWDKNSRFPAGEYTDPFGRTWHVVPEVVNSHSGKDGYEIVTPPLDRGEQDHQVYHKFLSEVEKTGKYEPGMKSSTHFTIDAKHLIKGEGDNADASKLVDTILYIENHWPEIYSAMSPTRYGTLINRFGVPLAAEPKMKELLDALAAMPKKERTFGNVRALFEKYDDIEKSLWLRDGQTWKYRAANYKKLFGLQKTKQIPVIEFRLGDLTDAETITKQSELLQKVVANAHRLEPNQHEFKDPFKGGEYQVEHKGNAKREKRYYDDLNTRIAQLPAEQYKQFLGKLGYNQRQFPKLGRVEGPLTMGMSKAELDRFITEFDTSKPIVWGSKAATFGFEAEADGPNVSDVTWRIPFLAPFFQGRGGWVQTLEFENPVLDWLFGWIPIPQPVSFAKRTKYPYLNLKTHVEELGNTEMSSKVYNVLDEAIDDMGDIRSALGHDLKGFHLHVRIPKEAWSKIPEDELNAWLSRIADVGMLWRLKFRRKTWFALESATHSRLDPQYTSDRGAIRAIRQGTQQEGEAEKNLGDWLDIELRGFMRSHKSAQRLMKIILAGFQNPELIRGFPVHQPLLLQKKHSLATLVESFGRKYKGIEKLSPKQKEFFEQVEKNFGVYLPEEGEGAAIYKQKRSYDHTSNLPLMGFEEAPYLTPLQRRKIEEANFAFMRNMWAMMDRWDAEYPDDDVGIQADYRQRVKYWANTADLHSTLERTLLLDPERVKQNPEQPPTTRQARALLLAGDERSQSAALDTLRKLPNEEFFKSVPNLATNSRSREAIIELLKDRKGPEALKIVSRALGDEDPAVRAAAVRIVGSWTDAPSFDELRKIVNGSNNPLRESAAIEALALRQDKGPRKVGKSKKTRKDVFKEGREAARFIVTKLLFDDWEASTEADTAAMRVLADRGAPGHPPLFSEEEALPLLKKAINHSIEEPEPVNEGLRGLVHFKNREAVDLIVGRLWKDDEQEDLVRREAARILAENPHLLTEDHIREILEESPERAGVADVIGGTLGKLWKGIRKKLPGAPEEETKPAPEPVGLDRTIPEFQRLHLEAAKALSTRAAQSAENALPAIREGLSHDDPEVRAFAAQALAHLPKNGPGSELIAEALENKDVRVVREAAKALKGWNDAIGWQNGIIPLIRKLMKHNDVEVARAAVSSLAGRNTPESAEAIMAALGSKDEEVRILAAQALQGGRSDEVAGKALTIAMGSKNARVKQEATRALAQKVAQSGRVEGVGRSALISRLADPEPGTREVAAQGLSEFADEDLLEIAKEVFSRANTPQAALQREGVMKALTLKVAKHQPSEEDSSSVSSAKERSLKMMEPIFEKALEDSVPGVLEHAYNFYAALGKGPLLKALKIASDAKDPQTRQWAAEALAKTDWARLTSAQQDTFLELAKKALSSPDPMIHEPAARALAKRNTKPALEVITDALSPRVGPPILRQAAARALIGRVDAESLRHIERALKDPDPQVRAHAASALAGRGGPTTASLIGRTLKHDEPVIRANAATALVGWNGDEAWAVLREALDSHDREVRLKALEALTQRDDLSKHLDESLRHSLVARLAEADGPLVEMTKKVLESLRPAALVPIVEEAFTGDNRDKVDLQQRMLEVAMTHHESSDPNVPRMMQHGLTSNDPHVYAPAFKYFELHGHDSFIAAMKHALDPRVPSEVRRRVAKAIQGRYSASLTVPKGFAAKVMKDILGKPLAKKQAPPPPQELFKSLLEFLRKTEDSPKFRAAVAAMNKITGGEVENLTSALFEKDQFRVLALKELQARFIDGASEGGQQSLMELLDKAFHDDDAQVRQHAQTTLKRQESKAAVDLIQKLVNSDIPHVRHTAAPAVIGRKDSDSLILIQESMNSHTDPEVKKIMTEALKHRHDEAAEAVRENTETPAAGLKSKVWCTIRKVAGRED